MERSGTSLAAQAVPQNDGLGRQILGRGANTREARRVRLIEDTDDVSFEERQDWEAPRTGSATDVMDA